MLVCYFVSTSSILARRCSRGIHSSAPLHSAPLDPLAPLDSSPPKSKADSKSVAASDTLFFSSSSLFQPAPATSETPSLPPPERTAHRGPELVASQYTAQPCSASLWRISWSPLSLLPPLPPPTLGRTNYHPPVSLYSYRRAIDQTCAGSNPGPYPY